MIGCSARRSAWPGVAARVGYGSEVALSAAFVRYFGLAPGAYRKVNRPFRIDQ